MAIDAEVSGRVADAGFGVGPAGRDAGGELEHGGGKVDLDEFALGGGHQLADVDGALIGGASLDPEELAKIAKFHAQA